MGLKFLPGRPIPGVQEPILMSFQPSNNDNVKRIVLPSGKTIEVVSFEEVAEQLAVPGAEETLEQTAAPIEGLHVCVDCDSTGGGVFEQDLLDEFDEELDRGMEELAADLGRLARSNMAEDVDRFIAAMKADAIQPMDF
jgi:hypothetical protein